MEIEKKGSLVLSAVLAFVLSGCYGVKNPLPKSENPIDAPNRISGDRVDFSKYKQRSVYGNLDKYMGGYVESDSEIPDSSIVKILDDEGEPPSVLLKRKVKRMDLFGTKLGDAMKLVLSDLPVNLIVEPNVDLNVPVNVKISSESVFEALRKSALSAGYHLYFSEKRNALVLSRFVTRKYSVPAEIFVNRTADVSFNSSKVTDGGVTPGLDMNSKPPKEILRKLLAGVGSKEKIVTFDEQSGLVVVKERPNFIDDIDKVIKDFVRERTAQFDVELVVAEISDEDMRKFGMNLYDIASRNNLRISSLGGTSIGSDLIGAIKSYGGLVLSAWDGYTSDASKTPRSDLAFKFLLDALRNSGVGQIVERPNVIVQNHSIGYVSVGDKISYVKRIKSNTVTSNGTSNTSKDVEIGEFMDGLQFAVKVDKYVGRDRIGVTLVPMMADTKLAPGPDGIQLLNRKIREAMSVVTVKDGDVIVLAGMKLKKGDGSSTGLPGIENVPLLGKLLGHRESAVRESETVFLVRVKQVRRAEETETLPSLKAKTLIRTID